MGRLPYQVIVIPYRLIDGKYQYCIFKRSTSDMIQWVSGGGEDGEVPYEAACRELSEEAGIYTVDLMSLQSLCHIPAFNYKEIKENYPNNLVVPEYSFACEIDGDISLSEEHESFQWVDYDTALNELTWDSNKTALYELKRRLESKDELWDVYNNFREKTGKVVVRDKEELLDGEYHLVVITWIIDSNNKFLVQRRSYDKELLPGLIATHGGSAVLGETSLVGAMREVYEEIGIALDMSKMNLFYSQFKGNCIYDSYIIRTDISLENVVIDKTEVDSCMYVTYEEMMSLIESGDFYDYRRGQGKEYLDLLKKEIEK